MSYDLSKFRIGPASVKMLPHDTGDGYHSTGEVLFDTLQGITTTIGFTMNGAELTVEAENLTIHPDEEQFAVLHGNIGGEAVLKLEVPSSLALLNRTFGRASGDVVERTIDGDVYDTAGPGEAIPEFVSLLVTQPRQTEDDTTDYLYIPRAMIKQESIPQTFAKKDLRTIPVEIACYGSRQLNYQTADGDKPPVVYIEDNNVTFDKVQRIQGSLSAATTFQLSHGTGYDIGGVAFGKTADSEIVEPATQLGQPNNFSGTFASAQTGSGNLFMPVSSEDSSVGDSEVHWQVTASSSWTLTAVNFAYPAGALIVLCFDQYGNMLTPASVTITPGVVATGTIAVTFAAAQRGRAVVFSDGPNGAEKTAHGGGATWNIDASAGEKPWLIQFYNGSYVQMTDWTSITYDAGDDEYDVLWPASRTGFSIGIY
jgi:hypothetical protein